MDYYYNERFTIWDISWQFKSIFYTTAMGIVLTLVVMFTRSLYATIFIHSVYNFIVSLPDVLYIQSMPILEGISNFLGNANTLESALVGCIVTAITLVILDKRGAYK